MVRIFDMECNLPGEGEGGGDARVSRGSGATFRGREQEGALAGYGMSNYARVFESRGGNEAGRQVRKQMSLAEHRSMLKAAGVEKAMIRASDVASTSWFCSSKSLDRVSACSSRFMIKSPTMPMRIAGTNQVQFIKSASRLAR